jgi:hypothetical protein
MESEIVPETIEVQFREAKPVAAPYGRRANGNVRRGKSRGSPRGLTLRALSPKGEGLMKPPGQDYYDKIYAEAKGSSEWPEEAWGAHGADFSQYAEHIGHLDQLRQEIEHMLFYPSVLSRRRIKGVINARITFAGGSRCAFKKTRVEGAEPYLRVYVLALIDKVCRLSFVARMGLREGQKVDLSFNFYISENQVSREQDEQQSRITGNVLTFQRGFTESSLEWELGPIRGVWFAPMVFLNVPWVVENWETYVDKKDPLRDFR